MTLNEARANAVPIPGIVPPVWTVLITLFHRAGNHEVVRTVYTENAAEELYRAALGDSALAHVRMWKDHVMVRSSDKLARIQKAANRACVQGGRNRRKGSDSTKWNRKRMDADTAVAFLQEKRNGA